MGGVPIGILRDYGLTMHQGVDEFYCQVLDEMTSLHFGYLVDALPSVRTKNETLKKKNLL